MSLFRDKFERHLENEIFLFYYDTGTNSAQTRKENLRVLFIVRMHHQNAGRNDDSVIFIRNG